MTTLDPSRPPAVGSPAASTPSAAAEPAAPPWRRLLAVAWMSIALGVGMELLMVGVLATAGPLSLKAVVADLAGKVSWSFLVCLGLAIGSTVAKARPEAMGLLGALSAPLGFRVARTAHKSAAETLGLAVAGGAFPYLIAALKGVEYALLGALLGAVGRRGKGAGSYLAIGAAVGVVCGGIILTVTARAGGPPQTLAAQLARAINEVIFPVGCSLVIYASDAMARRMAPR